MDENVKQKCISIIDSLMSHPIAEIFISPVDPKLDNCPDYFDIIKKPSDLTTVRSSVEQDKYKSIQEFKKDVDQIWENAILYNGRMSLPAFMAEELEKIFHKQLRQVETPSKEDWISSYAKSQAHMYKLFRSQPKQLEQFNLSPDTEMLVPERRLARSWLQAEDTKLFQEVFRFIDNPVHLAKLKQIFVDNEPSVDPNEEELHINLSALSQKTLKLLRAFAVDLKEQQQWQPAIE